MNHQVCHLCLYIYIYIYSTVYFADLTYSGVRRELTFSPQDPMSDRTADEIDPIYAKEDRSIDEDRVKRRKTMSFAADSPATASPRKIY